jgi:hypothetical protein
MYNSTVMFNLYCVHARLSLSLSLLKSIFNFSADA